MFQKLLDISGISEEILSDSILKVIPTEERLVIEKNSEKLKPYPIPPRTDMPDLLPPRKPRLRPSAGPCPIDPDYIVKVEILAGLVKAGVIAKDKLIGVLSAEGFQALDKIMKK